MYFKWSYALEKANIGSAFAMSWSSDSTQIVCGCGSGQVIVGNVIEKYSLTYCGVILISLKIDFIFFLKTIGVETF